MRNCSLTNKNEQAAKKLAYISETPSTISEPPSYGEIYYI